MEYWENTSEWCLEGELWKDIAGYEGLYQVSDLGRVRGLERSVPSKWSTLKVIPKTIKNQRVNRYGYLRVSLSALGKKSHFSVHRLVCGAFIDNPEGKPQVNHKDGNKKNNTISNLEWVDGSENIQHAINELGLMTKAVICVETGVEYVSATEASKKTGIYLSWLYEALKNPRYTPNGFHWVYKKDYDPHSTPPPQKYRKRIKCVQTGAEYDSIRQAERELNLTKGRLGAVLRTPHYTANGLNFEYV